MRGEMGALPLMLTHADLPERRKRNVDGDDVLLSMRDLYTG